MSDDSRIQGWVREVDIAVHPYMIVCHTSKEEEIKSVIQDDRVVIHAVSYIPEDEVLFVDRRKLQLYQPTTVSDVVIPYQDYFGQHQNYIRKELLD